MCRGYAFYRCVQPRGCINHHTAHVKEMASSRAQRGTTSSPIEIIPGRLKTHVRSLARLAVRRATLDPLCPSRTLSGRCRPGDAGPRSGAAAPPQCLRPDRRGRRARRREGRAGALAEGRAALAARRRADHDQGHHPGQGLADALRLARHRRDGGDGERRGCRQAPAGGHGAARQDRHAGVRLEGAHRLAAAGDHPQPVGPEPFARRLLGRRLVSHRGRRQSVQSWQRRRRLGPHSRRAYRPRWAEAVLWPHRAVSRPIRRSPT